MTVLASSLVLLALLLVLVGGRVDRHLARRGGVGGAAVPHFQPAGRESLPVVLGSSASWTLAALPLFVWMGEIMYRTRLSDEMFEGLAPWLGWLPGRLMHVNILGCAIFGTVSGSSCDLRDHRQGGAARAEEARLRREGLPRLASRRRNARHPAAAFDHHGGVRGGGRGVYHQGVPRRLHSGPYPHAPLPGTSSPGLSPIRRRHRATTRSFR